MANHVSHSRRKRATSDHCLSVAHTVFFPGKTEPLQRIVESDQRGLNLTALAQFLQCGVRMLANVALQGPQCSFRKDRFPTRILSLGFKGALVSISLQDVLDRSFRDSKTLGNLAHRLVVHRPGSHDSLSEFNWGWFHT